MQSFRFAQPWFLARSAVVVLVPLLAGCGGGEFPTYPVRGIVMLEGKPLPGGGSIRFVPLGESGQTEAGGTIAADGSYRLTTFREFDGATAGEYRVEIYQNPVQTPAVYPEQPDAVAQGEEPAYLEPITPEVRVAPADLIPLIYAEGDSPLRATVEKRVNENVNFNLSRRP
jgi:hypothetical protein